MRSSAQMPAIESWLDSLSAPGESDLYISVGAAPVLRGDSGFRLLSPDALNVDAVWAVVDHFLNATQRAAFDATLEFNMAWSVPGVGRFRVNMFRQRQHPGLVIRHITARVPTVEDLGLPPLLSDLVMEKRGLIIVSGATGSGKSTSLAAMIGHRNGTAPGHIITIEDPVEFIHEHRQCVVTQREVGVDTLSFESALKNALRQKPDVILVGEVRDTTTMEQAINMAETGHLVLMTLHASNAHQAIDRILGFYPHENHRQILLALSLNLRAILCQRLVPGSTGGRVPALEVLLNRGYVKDLVRQGDIRDIRRIMSENRQEGMGTFDQDLIALARAGRISEATALAEADAPADMRLALRQEAGTGPAPDLNRLQGLDTSRLALGHDQTAPGPGSSTPSESS